jgi:acetyl esterase/lipase
MMPIDVSMPRLACVALSLLLAASFGGRESGDRVVSASNAGDIMNEQARRNSRDHLTAEQTIADLLSHPAFSGFGRLLLPWDDRAYDNRMRLREVGALLPYHSHVDPGTVVSALNHMIDDVNDGKTIFYEFYTEAQKKEQPAKVNTGLFFFRGNPGAPFAVIAPGGGFSYVGSVHEGFPYAEAISKQGYNAFVLRYRAGAGGAVATRDLAAAISYVVRNARMFGVSTEGYSVWGSSAGARMAAAIGSRGIASFGGDTLPKPSAVVMAYTGHSEYSANEPPTFVVVGEQDGIAPPSVMERRVAALRKAGTQVEFHQYIGIGHGFGAGTGTTAEGWIDRAIRFWERFMTQREPCRRTPRRRMTILPHNGGDHNAQSSFRSENPGSLGRSHSTGDCAPRPGRRGPSGRRRSGRASNRRDGCSARRR